ncbi:TcdA/TcdB catalytic glycosyltransferase domain-containing protein, partial [Serratia sp. IR-2025]
MNHGVLGVDLPKIERLSVPNILHFVWIGDLNEVNTHYIDIWRKTNKDKQIFFWYDKDSSLCHLLNNAEFFIFNSALTLSLIFFALTKSCMALF